MAAKVRNPDELARRYTLGIIMKYMAINQMEPLSLFGITPPTWNSRKNCESDFTVQELRMAARLLQIPAAELAQMIRVGE